MKCNFKYPLSSSTDILYFWAHTGCTSSSCCAGEEVCFPNHISLFQERYYCWSCYNALYNVRGKLLSLLPDVSGVIGPWNSSRRKKRMHYQVGQNPCTLIIVRHITFIAGAARKMPGHSSMKSTSEAPPPPCLWPPLKSNHSSPPPPTTPRR